MDPRQDGGVFGRKRIRRIEHDHLAFFMSEGAAMLGLRSEELPADEGHFERRRSPREKTVICSVGPGDFTTEGHFIVISARTAQASCR